MSESQKMDMKGDTIVVFGAEGQLGWQLAEQARAQGAAVVALGRAQADVTDPAQVRAALEEHQPDVVFNGAAYNAVDRAEEDADAAMRLNGLAPGHIAAACRQSGAAFMHFSTDYVFGHGHTSPIDESYEPAPLSVYGRSKRLGEVMALQNNPRTFVVRCCGLYSARRRNFVRTMIHHALKGTSLTVVSDQIVSPTWVEPLAGVALALSQTETFGVYHAVAHGQCSWYEYASRIFELLELDADLSPVAQADWGAPAPRPAYSSLQNRLLGSLELDAMEPWDVALERFLATHGEAIVEQERAAISS